MTALQNAEGSFVPVHVVPVSVTKATVDMWQTKGYELEVTPL